MNKNLANNTLYEIKTTSCFDKSLKKIAKQGKDLNELKNVIKKLANNEQLDYKYRNHKLIDDKYYKNCFECHIRAD